MVTGLRVPTQVLSLGMEETVWFAKLMLSLDEGNDLHLCGDVDIALQTFYMVSSVVSAASSGVQWRPVATRVHL